MNILFWGTPDYAVPTLVALHQAGHTLVGVVTQPDRRRGRGKTLIPSPVKAKALEMGLKVFTPQRIKQDESCQEQLAELQGRPVRSGGLRADFAKKCAGSTAAGLLERPWISAPKVARCRTDSVGAA